MAHIIAASSKGPRGQAGAEPSEVASYENALLLCTICHDIVDAGKLQGSFPVDLLREWKVRRAEEVEQAVGTPTYASREELIAEIRRLLAESRAVWAAVGPGGPQFDDPRSPRKSQWDRQVASTVIPNNQAVLDRARRNDNLLTADQRAALAEFRVHADAFAYNATLRYPHEGAPRFPDSMKLAFEEETR